ncbi:hypothetical protein [Actinoalloteichus sp. GBA129-24]|uniref:hypothetical protein n=1 Tax=Actinoalloteichus sp. GBA129-24 TaxID=1612551 RepID=UPI0012FA829A|nr:hypothetical protein [Actinoalloteichus sp. GBA129-24]
MILEFVPVCGSPPACRHGGLSRQPDTGVSISRRQHGRLGSAPGSWASTLRIAYW